MAAKENSLSTIEPTEKGLRSLERIRERFSVSDLPDAFSILSGSESGIHDLYMNLNRQLEEGKLSQRVKYLIAVAVSAAAGSAKGTEFFSSVAIQSGIARQEVADAVSVALVCGIFNGYYRFRHQLPAESAAAFESFRAPFNANSFMKGTLQPFDVEAVCVAVSSYNNCHQCVEGHLHKAKSLGMTDEQVDEAIKVTAACASASQIIAALSIPRDVVTSPET